MMGKFPSHAPWQAPVLTLGTQLLNAIGALFLVMALSRGKATIVAPVTNALAPVLTIVLSLAVYQTVPSIYGIIGIVLAIGGSTLMVYADEAEFEISPVTPKTSRLNLPPESYGSRLEPGQSAGEPFFDGQCASGVEPFDDACQ